jgi:hypothetical protein
LEIKQKRNLKSFTIWGVEEEGEYIKMQHEGLDCREGNKNMEGKENMEESFSYALCFISSYYEGIIFICFLLSFFVMAL